VRVAYFRAALGVPCGYAIFKLTMMASFNEEAQTTRPLKIIVTKVRKVNNI